MAHPHHHTNEHYLGYRRCVEKIRPGDSITLWLNRQEEFSRGIDSHHHHTAPITVVGTRLQKMRDLPVGERLEYTPALLLGNRQPVVYDRRFWDAEDYSGKFQLLTDWRARPHHYLVYDDDLCVSSIIRRAAV